MHAILTEFSEIYMCVSKRRVWLMCSVFFFHQPSEPWAPCQAVFAFADQRFHICWAFPLRCFAHLSTWQSSHQSPSIPPGSLSLGRKYFHLDFHLQLDFGKHQSLCHSPDCLSDDAVTWLWMHIERGDNKPVFPSFCFFFQGSRQVFHHFTGLSARASGQCTRQNCAESWSFYEGIWWFWWRRPKPAGEVRAHQTSSTTAVLRIFLCHNCCLMREGEDVTHWGCRGFVKIMLNFILVIFSNWKYLSCFEVMK